MNNNNKFEKGDEVWIVWSNLHSSDFKVEKVKLKSTPYFSGTDNTWSADIVTYNIPNRINLDFAFKNEQDAYALACKIIMDCIDYYESKVSIQKRFL